MDHYLLYFIIAWIDINSLFLDQLQIQIIEIDNDKLIKAKPTLKGMKLDEFIIKSLSPDCHKEITRNFIDADIDDYSSGDSETEPHVD